MQSQGVRPWEVRKAKISFLNGFGSHLRSRPAFIASEQAGFTACVGEEMPHQMPLL